MKQLIESLPEAVMMVSATGDILAANALMQNMLGYATDELLSKNAADLAPANQRAEDPEWPTRIASLIAPGGKAEVVELPEMRVLTRDGDEIAVDIRLKRIDPEETEACVIASFRHSAHASARRNSGSHAADPLADLADRDAFLESVQRSIGNAQTEGRFIAILAVEGDQYQKIADTLGSDAAEEYVREMVSRISRISRKQDTVARLAADEFAVAIDSLADPGVIHKLATRIQSFLSAPAFVDEHSFSPRPHIGVSVFPTDAQENVALLRSADLAMRNAKKAQKGEICFFSDEMGEHARQRLTLENDLRCAVFRDEFEVHFQPFFDFGSATLSGVESFLRWQHPQLGTIELRDFMRIAEETGMAGPLSETALWLTFEAIRKWQEMGHWPMDVIHSLSPAQLSRPESLLRQLRGLLLNSNIDPKHIQFAVPETEMPLDEKQIAALLQLAEMGFRIIIDDFGVGASPLSYLLDLPIDAVKLAPGLLTESIEEDRCRSVLSAAVQMAHHLDIKVIASDIESDTHLEVAKTVGCDAGQGDWQCPSLDFDKLCSALFSKHQAARGARNAIEAAAPERELSRATG